MTTFIVKNVAHSDKPAETIPQLDIRLSGLFTHRFGFTACKNCSDSPTACYLPSTRRR